MTARSRLLITGAILASFTLTACLQPPEDPVPLPPEIRTAIEQDTREYVQALAAQLGTTTEVQDDSWTGCVDALTGNEYAEQFVHGIRVDLERTETFEEAAARLQAHFVPLGWTWREPDASIMRIGFTHDGYRVGASVFIEDGYAWVSGGAGCLSKSDVTQTQP